MNSTMAPYGMCLTIMNERNSKGGMGSKAKPLKFMDQDYHFLQDYCLQKKLRFLDDYFPPDPRSIGKGLLKQEDMLKIEWKRPKAMRQNAEFVVDGVSRFDYAQGSVGNCWFLASVGALTFQKDLLLHIVPPGQSLINNYAGIFHFRFWRFGKWYDVVIDDKLPTINDRLIFVQSKTNNEFWPALLEKAYAKVCGSYADMHAGRVCEALLDFSGGVHMHYELNSAPPDLWEMMHRANQANALMGCETPVSDVPEKKLHNGIVLGHAYAVTGVHQVMSGRHPVQLVRLFNPWGDTEWTGDWSDMSPLWNTVSEGDKKKHLLAENGEFWMSMKDYTRIFDNMDICCPCPDFLEKSSQCQWTSKYHQGRWVTGSTAGGYMNYKDTFCTNPQFWLTVGEMDKTSEDGHNNVLVSLIQKPDKRNRRSVSIHAIGFSVFEIPPEMRSEGRLGSSFFHNRTPVETSGDFQNVRQVMKFFRLEPGQYLIVPSTNKPNNNAEFFLSILCKNEIQTEKDTERTEKDFLVDFTKGDYTDPVDNESNYRNQNVGLFRQFSDQYKDVDAGQLQQLLHNNLFGGNTKISEGFGLDTCRSMIAMSDSSITGRLNGSEFMHLWNRIIRYKDIFYSMHSTKDGVLSLKELNKALEKTGMHLSEEILNLMAVRYGGTLEQISLEGFICLVLRLDCMAKLFQRLCNKGKVTFDESEWIRLTMYS
ncbi:calpain-1 catalytic subunit [Paramisgurnus dabryanus]|uniref:calpain-1 catalytic subunit n=1 Tax=Paramisgurnus dabryanus TaxID=90735 RepID=UPI0031F39104